MAKLSLVLVLALAAGCSGGSSTPDAPGGIDAAIINTNTTLVASMMQMKTLRHGIYGVNADDGTLHVEVHLGGVMGCPEMNSPTPDYTVILGRVPPMTLATSRSPGNFLDYVGDMLPGNNLGAAATNVSLTDVIYTPGQWVTFDANMTFAAGTVIGHVYATHCPSLDG